MKFLNKDQEIWLDDVFLRQRMFYTEEWFQHFKPIAFEKMRKNFLYGVGSIFNLHDISKEKTSQIIKSGEYLRHYSSVEINSRRQSVDRVELINEILHDKICNPIMVSYSIINNELANINIHPGRTRTSCYNFLRIKSPALIHVKKSDFETDIFPYKVREIKHKEELFDLFKIREGEEDRYDKKDLVYSFKYEDKELKKGKIDERHDDNDCDILKIHWIGISDDIKKVHRADIQDLGNQQAGQLCDLLNEPIQLYTNSKIDVENYFNTIEDGIWIKNKKGYKKFNKNIKINYCEEKPKKFNETKGLSIWFDKDIFDINYRHLYEFLFFYYAKKSSTEDGKIQVMNFQTKQVKDFVTIHEQFYRRDLK